MIRPSYLGKPVAVFIFTSQMPVQSAFFYKNKRGLEKNKKFRVTNETKRVFYSFMGRKFPLFLPSVMVLGGEKTVHLL